MAATMPSGSVRGLFRSRITRDGGVARIWSSAAWDERANATVAPVWPAVDRIFELNRRSSRIARITR